jgi:hypothetical protein
VAHFPSVVLQAADDDGLEILEMARRRRLTNGVAEDGQSQWGWP